MELISSYFKFYFDL